MATIRLDTGHRPMTSTFYTAEMDEEMDFRGLNCPGINTVTAEAIRTLTSSGEGFQGNVISNPYSYLSYTFKK